MQELLDVVIKLLWGEEFGLIYGIVGAALFILSVRLVGDKNYAKGDGRFRSGYKGNIKPAYYPLKVRIIGWVILPVSVIIVLWWALNYVITV